MPYEYVITLPDRELSVRVADATFTPTKRVGGPPDADPAGHMTGAEARLEGVEFLTGALAVGDLEVASITITEGGNAVFEARDATVRYGTEAGVVYVRERA